MCTRYILGVDWIIVVLIKVVFIEACGPYSHMLISKFSINWNICNSCFTRNLSIIPADRESKVIIKSSTWCTVNLVYFTISFEIFVPSQEHCNATVIGGTNLLCHLSLCLISDYGLIGVMSFSLFKQMQMKFNGSMENLFNVNNTR